MIRDPSDGAVRETVTAEAEIPVVPNPICEAVRAAILAGKVKPEHLSVEWVYQRAWNDALDFALREIGKIEKSVTASTI
jgi:hypothetical protein